MTRIPHWLEVVGKPTTFPPATHQHDDLYYTQDEIDDLLDAFDTGFSSNVPLTNYNLAFAGNLTNTLGGNLAAGVYALKSAAAVNDSTVYGNQANEFTTDGVGYCSFGRYASQHNLTGTNTNAYGDSAGRFATGQQNCFYGYITGEYHAGNYGTLVGNGTGQGGGGLGHGDYATLYGYAVCPYGAGATRNAIFGSFGKYLGRGNDDSGLGHMVLYNSTGGENTAAGVYAGFTNVAGLRNTWFGESAGNDAVNQAPDLIGSIGVGSRSYTTRNYQAVFGGTTIEETYLRGKTVVNGTQAILPRGQLDVYGNGVTFISSSSTLDSGFRLTQSLNSSIIDVMDDTFTTAQPLYLQASEVIVNNELTLNNTTAAINLTNSNRWYQAVGSSYFESNGNFWFRNYTGSYPIFLIASDGRTFPMNDVWHTSLNDGVARLLYLANGATQFNDAQNFVGTARGHGLYSDGSIRWGSAQTGNARGTLSWDTDTARIIAPLYLSLEAPLTRISNRFTLAGLPTSSAGLEVGEVWRDGTDLKIVT